MREGLGAEMQQIHPSIRLYIHFFTWEVVGCMPQHLLSAVRGCS